jgi:hypothetical protein
MQVQSTKVAASVGIEARKKSELAVKVKRDQQKKAAEDVQNPKGRDKIELSRASFAEELALLKAREKKEPRGESLDDLQSRLSRAHRVLYQAAAVVAFDPESLRIVQDKVTEELEEAHKVLAKIELPELKQLPPKPEDVQLKSEDDLKDVRQQITAASEAVEKLKDKRLAENEDERTGKTLEVAHQNTTAALSNYNPGDIFKHADAVAQSLNADEDTSVVHGKLGYQTVISLIG